MVGMRRYPPNSNPKAFQKKKLHPDVTVALKNLSGKSDRSSV